MASNWPPVSTVCLPPPTPFTPQSISRKRIRSHCSRGPRYQEQDLESPRSLPASVTATPAPPTPTGSPTLCGARGKPFGWGPWGRVLVKERRQPSLALTCPPPTRHRVRLGQVHRASPLSGAWDWPSAGRDGLTTLPRAEVPLKSVHPSQAPSTTPSNHPCCGSSPQGPLPATGQVRTPAPGGRVPESRQASRGLGRIWSGADLGETLGPGTGMMRSPRWRTLLLKQTHVQTLPGSTLGQDSPALRPLTWNPSPLKTQVWERRAVPPSHSRASENPASSEQPLPRSHPCCLSESPFNSLSRQPWGPTIPSFFRES